MSWTFLTDDEWTDPEREAIEALAIVNNGWEGGQATSAAFDQSGRLSTMFSVAPLDAELLGIVVRVATGEIVLATTDAELTGDPPTCRVCGCTDEQACDGGCTWVEPDLCSSCEGKG